MQTTPPESDDPADMEDYLNEWQEYAKAAGIVDKADIANVGRFMKQTPGPAAAIRR